MEDKIRKVIKEQIKKLHEDMNSSHLPPEHANQEYYDLLNDLRDEGHLHRHGVTQLQMKFGLSEEEAQEIYNEYIEDLEAEQPDAADFYLNTLNKEGMSPEEWEAAKEKERLDQHPEKDKIMKIKQMMDKEKMDKDDYAGIKEETNWYNIALDVAGLFPFVGEPADFANTVDYAIKGDYLMSALSAISMIPEVGDVVGKGGKLVVGTLKTSAKMTKRVIIVIRQNQDTIDKLFDTLERKSPDKFKPHIPKMKDALNKFATAGADVSDALSENQLKEIASQLGYLNEEVDEQGLDQIERGLNQITGGGRQSASVSDRGDKIRVKFSYMRGEFDNETWKTILEYLSDNMGYKILDQSNYYERNWEPEEPAEAVPMIHLKKNKSPIYPTNQKLRMSRTGPKNKPQK